MDLLLEKTQKGVYSTHYGSLVGICSNVEY